MFLDASTGGTVQNKSESEINDLVENKVQTEKHSLTDRGAKQNKKGDGV